MRSEVELANTAHGIGDDATVNVGSRLRALREQRRMSIRSLAEASGLAVNTLSLIENGRTSPSVSTLQRLAMTLQVPISAFFTPEAPQQPVVFTPAGQAAASVFSHGTLADLGPGLVNRVLEPLLLTLDPGSGSGPEPIIHTGQEFVFGLNGQICYTVANQTYTIGPGDSLLFEARLPHRWHNPGQTPAQALLVLCPLELPRSALERHGRF
ncbi:cupin domain-containing protein [Chloroflexus sp.]|uniref:cupin domain-containing protein n=1 Tax=Chloroflexus sp. TaxID=1904827 RepID=UPI0026327B44|nr:cupin domain-containing protein [uncultured Chloroflexus sp.]